MLCERIVALSEAEAWEDARLEWRLEFVYFADRADPGTCLCGHHPIIECCVMRNVENRRSTTVGNCCVKRFMDLSSEYVFQGMRKIKSDPTSSMNVEAADFAFLRGWISGWEHGFYLDVWRKRRLSVKQAAVKERINEKVLARMADVASRARSRERAERG